MQVRKNKSILKTLFAFILVLAIIFSFSACSKKINVTINDAYVTTQIEVSTNKTVAQILNDADITVGVDDSVTPSLDTVVSENSTITIARYLTVEVVYQDNDAVNVTMCGGTVGDAIEKANIKMTDKLSSDYELDTLLSDGLTIHIVELSTVTLTVDGKTKDYTTKSKTVSDFLSENNITLSKLDRLSAALDSKITDGMALTIKRVTTEEKTVVEEIEYSTTKQNSSDLESGKTKVKQKGINGEKEVTYLITYVDGVEESREVKSENITKKATDEIVLVGTKKSETTTKSSGKTVVSREYYDDCDGSGHGVCIITYSDGTTKMEEY